MPAFTRSELADLNVFMTIVRRRSFRHSAQELGVSTSALSHSMRNLEARLGVKLLNRTSRSVVPTDAGSALAAKLEDGFQVIGEALGELDAYRTSPVGRLRLNVPRDASRLLLGPVLRRFTEAYPDLQLELSVEDRMVDIVADGYDAGIRYGGTVPQDMVAVPLTGELRWWWPRRPITWRATACPSGRTTCCGTPASACAWATTRSTNGNWATASGWSRSTCPALSASTKAIRRSPRPWTALAWPTAWKWESPRSCVAAGCNWYCRTGPRWARRSASIIRADASRNPACAN